MGLLDRKEVPVAEEPKELPDLTGARVFLEADGGNIAQGKGRVLKDRVVFVRDNGGFAGTAVISPDNLKSNPSHRDVTAEAV